jgi:threonylcarbamoyladenosine tRNA methylthiotransferase MtaB
MHRKYDRELYASRVSKIRAVLPQACIAADVIVGFPGETDQDFAETMSYLEKLDISYLHVFTYSRRDRTLAASMQDPVPDRIKKGRSDALHQLSERKKQQFYMNNQGQEVRVLFESDNSQGFMHGFTENYIKVKTTFNPELANRIIALKLEAMDEHGIYNIDESTIRP